MILALFFHNKIAFTLLPNHLLWESMGNQGTQLQLLRISSWKVSAWEPNGCPPSQSPGQAQRRKRGASKGNSQEAWLWARCVGGKEAECWSLVFSLAGLKHQCLYGFLPPFSSFCSRLPHCCYHKPHAFSQNYLSHMSFIHCVEAWFFSPSGLFLAPLILSWHLFSRFSGTTLSSDGCLITTQLVAVWIRNRRLTLKSIFSFVSLLSERGARLIKQSGCSEAPVTLSGEILAIETWLGLALGGNSNFEGNLSQCSFFPQNLWTFLTGQGKLTQEERKADGISEELGGEAREQPMFIFPLRLLSFLSQVQVSQKNLYRQSPISLSVVLNRLTSLALHIPFKRVLLYKVTLPFSHPYLEHLQNLINETIWRAGPKKKITISWRSWRTCILV